MPEEKGRVGSGVTPPRRPPRGGASAGPVGRARPMKPVTLTDGTPVTLRHIRPEDESALTALYERLSPQTAYQRFFTVMRRLPPDWAHILANVDYDRRMAIVALGPGGELIGVARYVYDERAQEAEIAIVIEDRWQGRGLGTRLLGELIGYAEARGNSPLPGLRPRRQPAHAQAHQASHHDPGAEAATRGWCPCSWRCSSSGRRSGRPRSSDGLTPVAGRTVDGARRSERSRGPGRLSSTGNLRVNVAPWLAREWTSIGPEVALDDAVAHRKAQARFPMAWSCRTARTDGGDAPGGFRVRCLSRSDARRPGARSRVPSGWRSLRRPSRLLARWSEDSARPAGARWRRPGSRGAPDRAPS